MYEGAFESLELLDAGWHLMNYGAIHHRVRQSLARRGYAEFEKRHGYMRGRLTPAGVEFRNEIYRERARRLNAKMRQSQ